ncbi:MAG TPA: Rrf2 family transcriptional regulator [Anaerohalosphaeraceae bacterium]|nr:Rrf2 family transcriptional regulator [Anaerohalosphaeraceae bacterium]
MKLSSRTRYGMRAMMELALEYGKKPLQIKSIADREDISNKYLEQLVAMLKSSGLVRSVRGPRGGYMLARNPAEIKLSEIFTTLEGPLIPVECVEHTEFCPKCPDCATRLIWTELYRALMSVLDNTTLKELAERADKIQQGGSYQI